MGKTNSQTIGTTNNTEQRLEFDTAGRVFQSTDNNRVKTESVENVTVNETNPWVILLLVLGWLLPSPNEIGRSIRSLFSRKK